jgi:hypothetical protein
LAVYILNNVASQLTSIALSVKDNQSYFINHISLIIFHYIVPTFPKLATVIVLSIFFLRFLMEGLINFLNGWLMSFSLINFSGLCFIKKNSFPKLSQWIIRFVKKKEPVDYTQAVDRERTKSSRERENCQTM